MIIPTKRELDAGVVAHGRQHVGGPVKEQSGHLLGSAVRHEAGQVGSDPGDVDVQAQAVHLLL